MRVRGAEWRGFLEGRRDLACLQAGSRSWTGSRTTSVKTQANTLTTARARGTGPPEPRTGRRVREKGPVLGLGEEVMDTLRGSGRWLVFLLLSGGTEVAGVLGSGTSVTERCPVQLTPPTPTSAPDFWVSGNPERA